MSFSRVKLGGWAFGEVLTSAQMNALDVDHTNAVDGAGGGDSSPTAVIGIKGKGLSVGKALYDDTYFSTANAKWAGAAADFGGGPTIALRLVDLCSFLEGRLLGVAAGSNDKIALSLDDGFSWRDVSSSIASPQSINLTCCAAKDQVMIAGGNSAKVYNSVDTTSWAFITLGGSPTNLHRMHYHSGLDLFIVIGNTAAAPYLATVTSSVVGTPRTVPGAITGVQGGLSIAQSSTGRLVASWGSQTKVAYSDDAVTWTASTTSLASGSYLIAYGDGAFVAIEKAASSNAYVSTDGVTWTSSGVTKPNGTGSLQSFTALNGVFVAVDNAANTYFSVNKGATWEQLALQYLGYNFSTSVRAVKKRIHALITDGTNAIDMRSRRFGFADGTI
jgi:hypothetical protein